MILATLALAAHLVAWPPEIVQMGVSIGTQQDEYLMLMIPKGGCRAGMKIYSGKYGDFEKAVKFMEHSDICHQVDERAKNAKH